LYVLCHSKKLFKNQHGNQQKLNDCYSFLTATIKLVSEEKFTDVPLHPKRNLSSAPHHFALPVQRKLRFTE